MDSRLGHMLHRWPASKWSWCSIKTSERLLFGTKILPDVVWISPLGVSKLCTLFITSLLSSFILLKIVLHSSSVAWACAQSEIVRVNTGIVGSGIRLRQSAFWLLLPVRYPITISYSCILSAQRAKRPEGYTLLISHSRGLWSRRKDAARRITDREGQKEG